jgi:hypothetical protein
MIEMLKRHEIQVLRRAGHTWDQVAALTGETVIAVIGVGHVDCPCRCYSRPQRASAP